MGTDLARRWNLPEAVVATIAGFSGHEIGEDYEEIFSIVYAARVLAEYMLNSDQMEVETLGDHSALTSIGLYDQTLDALLEHETAIRAGVDALLI